MQTVDLKLFLNPFCEQCGDEIVMQIFKNTGVCCELCRKVRDGEISAEEWIARREVRDGVTSAPQES